MARGKIEVADEHYITHQTQRFMRRVRRRFVSLETFGPLALATGVAQESHLIGLRMVCDFLAWANRRVHWVSSNDRATVGQLAERLKPDAMLLSMGLDEGLTPAARLISDLRSRRNFGGLVLVGGARWIATHRLLLALAPTSPPPTAPSSFACSSPASPPCGDEGLRNREAGQ